MTDFTDQTLNGCAAHEWINTLDKFQTSETKEFENRIAEHEFKMTELNKDFIPTESVQELFEKDHKEANRTEIIKERTKGCGDIKMATRGPFNFPNGSQLTFYNISVRPVQDPESGMFSEDFAYEQKPHLWERCPRLLFYIKLELSDGTEYMYRIAGNRKFTGHEDDGPNGDASMYTVQHDDNNAIDVRLFTIKDAGKNSSFTMITTPIGKIVLVSSKNVQVASPFFDGNLDEMNAFITSTFIMKEGSQYDIYKDPINMWKCLKQQYNTRLPKLFETLLEYELLSNGEYIVPVSERPVGAVQTYGNYGNSSIIHTYGLTSYKFGYPVLIYSVLLAKQFGFATMPYGLVSAEDANKVRPLLEQIDGIEGSVEYTFKVMDNTILCVNLAKVKATFYVLSRGARQRIGNLNGKFDEEGRKPKGRPNININYYLELRRNINVEMKVKDGCIFIDNASVSNSIKRKLFPALKGIATRQKSGDNDNLQCWKLLDPELSDPKENLINTFRSDFTNKILNNIKWVDEAIMKKAIDVDQIDAKTGKRYVKVNENHTTGLHNFISNLSVNILEETVTMQEIMENWCQYFWDYYHMPMNMPESIPATREVREEKKQYNANQKSNQKKGKKRKKNGRIEQIFLTQGPPGTGNSTINKKLGKLIEDVVIYTEDNNTNGDYNQWLKKQKSKCAILDKNIGGKKIRQLNQNADHVIRLLCEEGLNKDNRAILFSLLAVFVRDGHGSLNLSILAEKNNNLKIARKSNQDATTLYMNANDDVKQALNEIACNCITEEKKAEQKAMIDAVNEMITIVRRSYQHYQRSLVANEFEFKFFNDNTLTEKAENLFQQFQNPSTEFVERLLRFEQDQNTDSEMNDVWKELIEMHKSPQEIASEMKDVICNFTPKDVVDQKNNNQQKKQRVRHKPWFGLNVIPEVQQEIYKQLVELGFTYETLSKFTAGHVTLMFSMKPTPEFVTYIQSYQEKKFTVKLLDIRAEKSAVNHGYRIACKVSLECDGKPFSVPDDEKKCWHLTTCWKNFVGKKKSRTEVDGSPKNAVDLMFNDDLVKYTFETPLMFDTLPTCNMDEGTFKLIVDQDGDLDLVSR